MESENNCKTGLCLRVDFFERVQDEGRRPLEFVGGNRDNRLGDD